MIAAIACAYVTVNSRAQTLHPFGDQQDDSYVNPILPGDFQNTDVLRVGKRFYYISATKAMSPGMAVLTSDDLVNWKFIGHVIPDVTKLSPRFNYDRMEGEMRGVWAGTLAYHAGLFYVYFTTPDEGIYVSTAKDPAGTWSPLTLLLEGSGWDDPAPLWDDDGKAYLATTNFALDPRNGKTYNIHLFKMYSDGLKLDLASDTILHQSKGSEANKLYKVNGFYYHFFSEVTSEGRVPMIGRSRSIQGPYKIRQLLHVSRALDREPNQGTILQAAPGKWVFVTHHGVNEWEGRPASALPVVWVDGWPLVGRVGDDGIGNMIWADKKPVGGLPRSGPQTSDDFSGALLSPQWEWYFQPRADKWSLTERPGYIRLYAFPPLRRDNLLKTPNILTQRPLRVDGNIAIATMDVTHLVDGQTAGLCFLGRTYASIGVTQDHGLRNFFFEEDGKVTAGPVLPSSVSTILLEATWGVTGEVQFRFSIDGKSYLPLGGLFQATSFGGFLGARLGIYTVNERAEAGYIDVDRFEYTYQH